MTFEPENLVIHCMLKYVEWPGNWGVWGGGEIFGDFFFFNLKGKHEMFWARKSWIA